MNTQTRSLLNLLAFPVVVSMNAIAAGLPLNGKSTGELSDQYPNLLTPTGFTFSIWSVIYLLLGAFVVTQWIDVRRSNDKYVQQLGNWWLINALLNSVWLVAWHYEQVLLSFLIMLGILFSLLQIYRRLNIGQESVDTRRKYFVNLPFQVYLGWISVATAANTTILLVDNGVDAFSSLAPTLLAVVLLVILILGQFMWRRSSDLAYNLVLLWALYGIWYANKTEAPIIQSAIVISLAVLLLQLVQTLWMAAKKVKLM